MLYHPERLDGCAPLLVRLFQAVGASYDCIALQGARTLADEQAAILAGTSHLSNPLDSLHVVDPLKRPFALAADVAPDPLDWKNLPRFWHFAGYVLRASDDLGIPIRWGGAWRGRTTFNGPGDLMDFDHFELTDP